MVSTYYVLSNKILILDGTIIKQNWQILYDAYETFKILSECCIFVGNDSSFWLRRSFRQQHLSDPETNFHNSKRTNAYHPQERNSRRGAKKTFIAHLRTKQ